MPLNESSVATSRRYTSPSGRVVLVSFISGIPGSVATHTPDVCYPGSGYKTLRATRKETFEVNGVPAAAYVADFEKKTQTKQDRVRVRWAWTTDGAWVAPDNPRWQFASQLRAPTIYKVYIASTLPDADGDAAADDDESRSAEEQQSPGAEPTTRPPAKAGARARSAPRNKGAACSPPYTVDARGLRHYKPECL